MNVADQLLYDLQQSRPDCHLLEEERSFETSPEQTRSPAGPDKADLFAQGKATNAPTTRIDPIDNIQSGQYLG
ncbi:MAG: hypothetical protein OXG21_06330 [Rhodobacteraceae bacterium]|nr:hypothetical protein [Paracoccaceae bacterium]MDE2739136.1 hypothetical protein [Paracoccaceae bacterium]